MPMTTPLTITPVVLALALLAAMLVGLPLGWWLNRIRHMKIHLEALTEISHQLDNARLEVVRLTEAHAAANVRAERAADLEEHLKYRESQISDLQTEISDLRSRGARLETIIRQDRQALKEKLSLVEGWPMLTRACRPRPSRKTTASSWIWPRPR